MSIRRFKPAAAVLAFFAAGFVALSTAGPGSGTATITPSTSVVAGTAGEWSLQYTAAEVLDNGTVRITIPTGWSAPQTSSTTSPGYVTVATNQPAGTPGLSIAGQIVTIAVDTLSVGNTVTLVYGDDTASALGRATAATTVGSYTFLVESDPNGGAPSPIASSPSLNVIASAPSSLDIIPNDSTATAGDFVQLHIRVLDAFGNRTPVASNRTVTLNATHGLYYDPSNHSTPIPSAVIASGTSSKRVDYRATAATTPGSSHTLFIYTPSGSPSLGGAETIHIVAADMSTTNSLISATSPVVADGVSQSNVVVTSRDAFGNPRAGDPVLIDATGSAVDVDPPLPTNENGQASGVVTNTVAQPVTVSATINALAITATAPITFTPGAVSATTSTVDATSPVTANGTSMSTVTVTARDALNNPIAGLNVTLQVSPSANATLNQPGGVTNSLGQVTGTLASTTVGPRTITATIESTGVTDNAIVQFNAGALASFQWTVDGNGTAGAFENVTLRARDAQGNTITNYTGTVSLSTTTAGVGDGVVQWDAVTPDADGVLTNLTEDDATYAFALSDAGVAILRVTNTRAETYQVRAQDGGVVQLSGNIVNASATADKIEVVSGNAQSATVNTAVASHPTVRVLDQFDNAVGGSEVTFTAVVGGGEVDATSGGAIDSTVVTASDGRIDCDVWQLGIVSGLNQLRARIASGSVPFVYFTATGTAGVGANLDIAPNSQSVTQGTPLVVTATLTDAFGNARSGERVDIAITDARDGALVQNPADPNPTFVNVPNTALWGNTDASGRITVRYDAPAGAPLSDVVDASTALIPQSSVVNSVYTTVASGATNLRITFVGPSTRPAGQTFQFLVEAVDGNNNLDPTNSSTVTLTPEAGGNLTFSETDFGPTVTQVTLAGGQETVYGRGTITGVWDIAVAAVGLGGDNDEVTITDTGVIDHYAVTTVPSVVAGVLFDVTVEAQDVYNNRVLGANNAVTLEAYDDVANTPAQASLLDPSATLASGRVTVAETYTKAEAIRVRASASGKQGFSAVVTVSAAPAHHIVKISGDASGVVAGATQLVTAQVLDAFENPVVGALVTFVEIEGDGSPSPPSANTNASGQVSTTWTTGTVAGDNRFKATIGDENPVGLERIDYLVTTVPGPVASFQVTPASYALVAGTGVALNVTGFDANGNLVSNDNATSIQLTETGSAQFGAATGTLTAGVFNTTVVDTVAQSFTITATRQLGGATGTSGVLTVSHAGAYRVTKVSGDASGVAVGGSQPLEVLVRDVYGNPVPNALVTFALTGALLDGSFTDGIGDPNDGITTTNGAGHALATLTTSTTVGTNTVNATILDGSPIARERVTFTVNTVAGGIAYYTVVMDGSTVTAGTTQNVTVSAFDVNDNPVDDDVTQVDLSPEPGSTGLVFGADPVTLTSGEATTTVRADIVGTYRVRANTLGVPAVTGLGELVTVNPAAPAGLITGTPAPATITANGVSTSTITSSVIQDAFGNQVPAGTPINVTPSLDGGTVLSGSPKLVGASGRIMFELRSSTTPGISTVTMASQTGTATGTVNVTFAPPPAFVAGSPNPDIVVPGDNAAFSVNVQNTSATDANLTPATTFTFTDGTRNFVANLAAPISIAGGGNQNLLFTSTTVDAAFTPAFYQPTVTLVGLDEFTAPINTPTLLPAQSLLVTSIQITAINAPPIVSRGQTRTVTVFVKNNGTQDADINDIDLNFTPGTGLFTPGTITSQTVAGGATVQFDIPVLVDPSCPVDTYTIDAVATGDVDGLTVTDNSIAPFTAPDWEIVAAANLNYVAGTMTPLTVSLGAAYQFRATINNGGEGVVSLDQGSTYMRFTDGTNIYQASPTQPYAIAGNSQQQIVFALQSVAAAFTPGSYGVSFHLEGTESGALFSQDPTSGADQVAVQTPADPAPGLVSPDQVSKGSSVSFTVQVDNSGGATVVLTPATTEFRFAGGAFTADLNPSGPTTLPPGNTTLTFLSTTVSQAIAAGSYAGSLVLNGFENGNPFSRTSPTENVIVDDAPDIQIVTNTPSQSPITADQTRPFKVRMVVRNNGGAAVTFTDASIKFIQAGQDRSGQFNISTPTGFAGGSTLNGGGAADTVIFDISDNPGNAMTAPAMMTIQGFLEVEDVNTQQAIFAERELGDFLQVQTPAAISVIAVVPSRTTVTQSMDRDFMVRALVQNTGTSDMTLNLAEPATDVTFTAPAGWVASPRNTLGNGGNVLAGGEIDTVLFNVTTSGTTTGTTLVNTNYTGTETNSGRVVTGGSSGSATITVETPVNIRITTTTHVAPNPGEANVDQPFDVRVLVQNTGEADARDVAIGMTSDGTSVIAPITPITEVAGGQTVAYDLGVVASNTPHPGETFTTSILSANDENSGEAVTPQASVDSTAVVVIQIPAVLDITSMSPSQATVTRGQTAPWNVVVRLHNNGEADAVLAPPAANDLAFAIGGSNQVDYVVQPPAAFGSGAADWTLPGDDVDSLIYVISVTGANEGLLDVTATVDGTDYNQPSLNVGDSDTISVLVQAPAGLAITTTLPVGTVNHENANRDTVNTNWSYQIHVTVDNTGEAVDSVLVQLVSDLVPAQRSLIAPASLRRQQIDVDGSHTFVFNITAPANPVALETFTSSILSGVRSHNTGQPVTPQPPVDNAHVVVTQRPADLVMNLTSASGAVSTNQVFTMSARVTNAGQAGVSGTSALTLVVPSGFALVDSIAEPRVRPFTVGSPVTWQIRAPAAPQVSDNFSAAISVAPIDRNTGMEAFQSQPNDVFVVAVVSGGAFTSPTIAIATPAGAVDGIVSAGQHLFLDATVTATTTTNTIVATLTVPAGYQIVGTPTRSLGTGTGSPVSINPDFEVIAPVNAGVGNLFVTFTGIDANTQQQVPTAADTLAVTTVPPAALTASASVTAPPEATDNSVTIGTTFTVTASVANAPSAAGIASPGTLTIALPSGYALAGGETAAKPFAIATAVTWQVNAPSQPSGPQQINVNITLPAPPDENSGQPALIVDGTASIAMVTEGSAVAVRDVSQALGIDVGPVPAGAADVRLLGFEIAYNVSDASVADARIDTIAVTIVAADGSAMGPNAVAATLSRLAIDIGGAAPYEVVDPSTNPVVVSFLAGAVAERSIAPDAVRNAIVSISLDGNPSASEFSVGLRSGALAVRDSQSGQRLGVTDSQGNPLNGAITSEPLIILSSQFSEYVHNYPNPFRAGSQDTRIAYVMQSAGSVSVQVYDLTGDLVYEESIPAGDPRAQSGPQETTWDGRNGKGEVVRNGIYVCVLNAGGQTAKFRIAVAK